jgi:hypothetical protein
MVIISRCYDIIIIIIMNTKIIKIKIMIGL